MDTNSEYSSSSPEESDTEELQMNPIQGAGQESQNGGDQDGDSKQSTILNNGLHLDEELGGLVSKYAKVNQPVPFSTEPPRLRLNLAWKDLNYKVVIPLPPQNFFVRMLLKLPIPNTVANFFKKKKEIPILNHLSGSVRAGEVVAIMGPTGSGKTTLLNVLAQRTKQNVTGSILVNGQPVKSKRMKRRMAYVLQDDIFYSHITVRNTVRDAAYLKLPKSLSWVEKRERVETVLTELGLQRCSNTIVGGAWVRGVSGGERKRTNIATEIVSNPALVFLDEPTSGLDAATSLGLIVSLKMLAKSGHTVVTTIHQPSSAMFMMFDKVILLAEGGWMVYSGPAREVLNYFSTLGLHAPSSYNPADFMLEVVTSTEKLKDGRSVKQLLIDNYAEQHKDEVDEAPQLELTPEEESSVQDLKHGQKYQTPFYHQVMVLAKRAFMQRRNDILSWDRIILICLIAILSGLLWFRRSTTETNINDFEGFLFFCSMFWIMNTWFTSLFAFPPERAVLNKERASGSYRLSAYFCGKMLAETPLELVLPLIFGCITYWMVNLSPNGGVFIFFLVILCLFTLMGSGIGLLISATVLDTKRAITVSVIIMLSSVLLGGFFISTSTLAVWISWAQWVSYIKYSYELILLNEFDLGSRDFTPSDPSSYTSNPIT